MCLARSRFQTRLRTGAAITDGVLGLVFLIVLGLALLDIGTLVLTGEQCGALAKQSARAAANTSNLAEAKEAVVNVASTFNKSSLYKTVVVKMDRYDGTERGNVHVLCSMTVNLPVSVPLVNIGPTIKITSQSTEPILGIAPPPPT